MTDASIPLSVVNPEVQQPLQTAQQFFAVKDAMAMPAIRAQQLEAAQQQNEAERIKIDHAKKAQDAENAYADLLKKHTHQVTVPTAPASVGQPAPQPPASASPAPKSQPLPVTATSDSAGQDEIGFPAGGPSDSEPFPSPAAAPPSEPPAAVPPSPEATPLSESNEPALEPPPAALAMAQRAKTAMQPSPLASQPQAAQAEPVIDYRGIVNDLISSGNPILVQRGQALQAQINNELKLNEDAVKQRLANAKSRVDLVGRTLNGVDENSDWTQVRRDLIAAGEPDAAIPLNYNKQWVTQKQNSAVEHKDFVAATQKAVEQAPKTAKEWMTTLGEYYGAVTNVREAIVAHDLMLQLGAPPQMVDTVGKAWMSGGSAAARKFSMTGEQQENAGGIAEKIPQLNSLLQDRWQVLHPGAALPTIYQLPPNATAKDWERIDKAMERTETAEGTKAQRAESNSLKQLMFATLNENRKASAERADQAAQDRAETRGMTQVIGNDPATGKPVMVSQARAKELGLEDITKLDSQDVVKANSARHFLPLTDNSDPANPGIVQLIDKLDKKGKLGVVASRWNDFLAGKVGAGDSDFERLRTRMGLATTLLMNLHVGSRGGAYMMEHFQDLANAGRMDASTLKAGVDEELKYARDRAMLPPTGTPAKKPAAAVSVAQPAQGSAPPPPTVAPAASTVPPNPWRTPAQAGSPATSAQPNKPVTPPSQAPVVVTNKAQAMAQPDGARISVNGKIYIKQASGLVPVQ